MKTNLNKFKVILRKPQAQLKDYLLNELLNLGYSPIERDGFLYAEGTLPVVLCAHMDTVHNKAPRTIHNFDGVLSSPNGIGGDDRCGVYMILEIIKEHKCSVVFTEDEEIGCVGAEKFVKSDLLNDIKVNYMVEFDRKGDKDAVFYDCANEEFEQFVLSTGFFKTAYGSFSDISTIAPALGVAAVNLSCGYYAPHTNSETINLAEMEKVIEEAIKLIQEPTDVFEYVELPKRAYGAKYDWGNEAAYYYNNKYDDAQSLSYGYSGLYDDDEEDPTSFLDSGFGATVYTISWNTADYELMETEVVASNEFEAIGYFLMNNPTVTYGFVVGVQETPY